MPKTLLLLVTNAMLSLYRLLINAGAKKVEGIVTHSMGYRYCCQFAGQEFMCLLEMTEDLGFQER
jgi:hypothetical protein